MMVCIRLCCAQDAMSMWDFSGDSWIVLVVKGANRFVSAVQHLIFHQFLQNRDVMPRLGTVPCTCIDGFLLLPTAIVDQPLEGNTLYMRYEVVVKV
jgi:hypothetical protein